MFAMSMTSMNTSADAWYAPVCQCASHNTNRLIPDTAVEAVSVLILGVIELVHAFVRIIIPHRQS